MIIGDDVLTYLMFSFRLFLIKSLFVYVSQSIALFSDVALKALFLHCDEKLIISLYLQCPTQSALYKEI